MKKIVLAVSALLLTPFTPLFAEAGHSSFADSKKNIESAVQESMEEAESKNEKKAWREFKQALLENKFNVATNLLSEEGVAENINKRISPDRLPPLIYAIAAKKESSEKSDAQDSLTEKQKAKSNASIDALISAIVALPQTNLNRTDSHYRTALHWVANKHDKKTLKTLLGAKRNTPLVIDAEEEGGWTPLQIAAESGDVAIIRELLKAGADINHTNLEGFTALMIAAANGQSAVVEELLEKKADVNVVNKEGKTALMEAIDAGSLESVQAILSRPEVDVLIRDNHGQKALTHVQLLRTKFNVSKETKRSIVEVVKAADRKAKDAAKAAKKAAKK